MLTWNLWIIHFWWQYSFTLRLICVRNVVHAFILNNFKAHMVMGNLPGNSSFSTTSKQWNEGRPLELMCKTGTKNHSVSRKLHKVAGLTKIVEFLGFKVPYKWIYDTLHNSIPQRLDKDREWVVLLGKLICMSSWEFEWSSEIWDRSACCWLIITPGSLSIFSIILGSMMRLALWWFPILKLSCCWLHI